MPKRKTEPASERQQVGVRLSTDAVELLELLQVFYGRRAGLTLPVSQSQAVETMLRETAKREGLLKLKGGTK
jgi:hypothetical protein